MKITDEGIEKSIEEMEKYFKEFDENPNNKSINHTYIWSLKNNDRLGEAV